MKFIFQFSQPYMEVKRNGFILTVSPLYGFPYFIYACPYIGYIAAIAGMCVV
jgi:hypothetical protein